MLIGLTGLGQAVVALKIGDRSSCPGAGPSIDCADRITEFVEAALDLRDQSQLSGRWLGRELPRLLVGVGGRVLRPGIGNELLVGAIGTVEDLDAKLDEIGFIQLRPQGRDAPESDQQAEMKKNELAHTLA